MKNSDGGRAAQLDGAVQNSVGTPLTQSSTQPSEPLRGQQSSQVPCSAPKRPPTYPVPLQWTQYPLKPLYTLPVPPVPLRAPNAILESCSSPSTQYPARAPQYPPCDDCRG